MIILDVLVLGVGLSMDAFAASVCKGLRSSRIQWRVAFITVFSFGLFQALMPVVGWALGSSFAHLIEPIDHWIAFILLAAVGAKMIWDALAEEDECSCKGNDLDARELVVLSVATSIDALVVGISLPMMGIPIWLASPVIGVTTFLLSLAGFAIGNRFGARYERSSAILGGVVLVLLGVKILIEHLSG